MKTFKTKKAETEYYRAMLNRYPFGSRLNDEDAKDLAALLDTTNAIKRSAPGSLISWSTEISMADAGSIFTASMAAARTFPISDASAASGQRSKR
jgi:hypothetical protein